VGGIQAFDRDDAVKPGVAGFPYLAHATSADGRKELVGPEFISGREGHA